MTTMISDLPMDLVEEILCRVPVKSIGAVRSTCKKWNILSKDQSFANKHIDKSAREKEFIVIAGYGRDYLLTVNLYKIPNKNFDLSINGKGKLITRENLDQVDYVFHCKGLLLCLCKHRLVVWNPYWGKTRLIKRPRYRPCSSFALGYDNSCGSYKILRLSSELDIHVDIYDLRSDSWRTCDGAFESNFIERTKPGLSVKGNTYWYAEDDVLRHVFLLCFDFTRERFGPRLPLPFGSYYGCNISLSSVKEEKLALLFDPRYTYDNEIDIWITNKIEPDAVSWSCFFTVGKMQVARCYLFGNFLIDEENKVALVFTKGVENAYIINGESGHFREVVLTQTPYTQPCYKFVGGYYVSSSLQI